jgi:hypothetical protein
MNTHPSPSTESSSFVFESFPPFRLYPNGWDLSEFEHPKRPPKENSAPRIPESNHSPSFQVKARRFSYE